MQSWIVGESEVEIIPPNYRNSPGRRVSLSSRRADFRQTVNLTREEAFRTFDRIATYNAFGQLGRQRSEAPPQLTAYA
jgi:hypothetical protein